MTIRTITDHQVAALPIHDGRAELLEEIMKTPVDQVDHIDHSSRARASRPRTRTWTAIAAAAAVAATVGGLATWNAPHEEQTRTSYGDGPQQHGAPYVVHDNHYSKQLTSAVRSVPGGAYFALGASGWSLANVDESATGLGLTYVRGDEELELDLYAADEYQTYVQDREDLGAGTSLSMLGQDATRWAYSADDHTLIRTPQGDRFLEVRGTGMDESAYLKLVNQIVQTDARGFADSLPTDVVTPYNRERAVRHLLRGVDTPPGFTSADVRLQGFNDAYQSAAKVAGSVGCAWVEVWAGGTRADHRAAVEAFESSRSWPLLVAIADEGGYSSGFWDVGAELRTGLDDRGDPVKVSDLRSAICS